MSKKNKTTNGQPRKIWGQDGNGNAVNHRPARYTDRKKAASRKACRGPVQY